jgi:hypothetical protein
MSNTTPNNFYTAAAERIRQQMAALSLNQGEMEKLLGIGHVKISGILNNKPYGRLNNTEAESLLSGIVDANDRASWRAMPDFPQPELTINQALAAMDRVPMAPGNFGPIFRALRTEIQGATPGLKLGHKELAMKGTSAAMISLIENENVPNGPSEAVGRALVERLGTLSGRNYSGQAGFQQFYDDARAAHALQREREDLFAPTLEAIMRDKHTNSGKPGVLNHTDFLADVKRITGEDLGKNFTYNCLNGSKVPTPVEVGIIVQYMDAGSEQELYQQQASRRDAYGLAPFSQRPLPENVQCIRALRSELGIEQDMLSRAAGLAPTAVRTMESERRTPLSASEENALISALQLTDREQLFALGQTARQIQHFRNQNFGDALGLVRDGCSSHQIADELGVSKGMVDSNLARGNIVPSAARQLTAALHAKGHLPSARESALYAQVALEVPDAPNFAALETYVEGFNYSALSTAAQQTAGANRYVGKSNVNSRT